MFDSAYEIDDRFVRDFARDGHALVRGLASREEIGAMRPVIGAVVNEFANADDRQGRIDDYSRGKRRENLHNWLEKYRIMKRRWHVRR